MGSRKMTQQEIEAWKKFYAKDLEVVGDFYFRKERCDYYRLYFKDGTQIIAEYDFCADSDNDLELDDPYYEDLYEFYFIVRKIEKGGKSLGAKENEYIALNYHNFFEKFEPYYGEIETDR